MTRTKAYGLIAAGLLAVAAFSAAQRGGAKIARIIVVQTSDVKAYVREVTNLQGLFKKANQTVSIRVFRAMYAGPEAGTVVVSVETSGGLAAIGALNALQSSNAEIAAEMQKIGGLRKILSDSIYEELTP